MSKAENTKRDVLGRELKIGQLVSFADSAENTQVDVGVVDEFTPKKVRVRHFKRTRISGSHRKAIWEYTSETVKDGEESWGEYGYFSPTILKAPNRLVVIPT